MRTNLHHGEFLLRSELIELAAIATISFHAASRFAERTDKALSPKVCVITLFIRVWHSFKRMAALFSWEITQVSISFLNRMERVSHLSSLRTHKTHCLTNL